jgi:hypothetical protein
MYDAALLLEKLEQIEGALAKIERRFANIGSPDDFLDRDQWLDLLGGTIARHYRGVYVTIRYNI